ncbi:hypothetical protein HpRN110_10610 [Helicobacter pylori]
MGVVFFCGGVRHAYSFFKISAHYSASDRAGLKRLEKNLKIKKEKSAKRKKTLKKKVQRKKSLKKKL